MAQRRADILKLLADGVLPMDKRIAMPDPWDKLSLLNGHTPRSIVEHPNLIDVNVGSGDYYGLRLSLIHI